MRIHVGGVRIIMNKEINYRSVLNDHHHMSLQLKWGPDLPSGVT
jgi:hypothetical protein